MDALILAAGLSQRLQPLTKERPKPLLPLWQHWTVLDAQLRALYDADIRQVFVITGHGAEHVRDHLRHHWPEVRTVHNPDYYRMNNVSSVYVVRDLPCWGSILLLNGDVVFDPALLTRACVAHRERRSSLIVVDPASPLDDEEMKVRGRKHHVLQLSKALPREESIGEYIGLAIFRAEDWPRVGQAAGDLIKEGYTDTYYEDALNTAIRQHALALEYILTNGEPWLEIDVPADYQRARELFKRLRAEGRVTTAWPT